MLRLSTVLGEDFDLLDDSSVAMFVQNNAISLDLQGDWSLPLSLPNTPRNQLILKQNDMANNADGVQTIDIYIYESSIFHGLAKLLINKIQQKKLIECTVIRPVGMFDPKIYNADISTLNLGEYIFPTNTVNSDFWVTTIVLKDTVDPKLVRSVSLWVANLLVYSYDAYGKTHSSLANLLSTFVVNANQELGTTAELLQTKTEIVYWIKTANPSTVSIAVLQEEAFYSFRDLIIGQIVPIQLTFQMARLTYQYPVYSSSKNDSDAPFFFPKIAAPNFFSSTKFGGSVNALDTDNITFLRNNEVNTVKYWALPALKFKYVVDALFRILGYQTIWTTAYFDDYVLIGNLPLEKQCPGLNYPFNVGNPIFSYASQFAGWKLKEAIQWFRLDFGLDFKLNTAQKIVTIDFLKAKINQAVTENLSGKIDTDYDLNYIQKQYQYAFDGILDQELAMNPDQYTALPLFNKTSDFSQIALKIPPVAYTQTVLAGFEQYAAYLPIVPNLFFKAKSSFFGQNDTKTQFRTFKIQPDGTMLKADSMQERFSLFLEILYNVLTSQVEAEVLVNLSFIELSELIGKKIIFQNVNWLVKSYEVTLPIVELTKLTLVRIKE
jgi:hypothetical protein